MAPEARRARIKARRRAWGRIPVALVTQPMNSARTSCEPDPITLRGVWHRGRRRITSIQGYEAPRIVRGNPWRLWRAPATHLSKVSPVTRGVSRFFRYC
jgi:hypothetical protein